MSSNVQQVNNTSRCCAYLKPPNSHRQCTFKSSKDGFCKRHYKMLQNKPNSVKTIQQNDLYKTSDYNRENISGDIFDSQRKHIVLLQSVIRMYIVKLNIYYRGISIYCRHTINNDEDCASFQSISMISNQDLFTYKDMQNKYWGFDIATFKEILAVHPVNPYNMLPIEDCIIEKFNLLLNKIEKTREVSIQQDHITDPEMIIQQRCFSIFQKIDELKYYTQCEWFLDLDLIHLKELYRQLEDIWNYRANLTSADKFKYSPNGKLFTHTVFHINKMTNRNQIANILLDNFEILVTKGKQKEDRITGSLWILGGLTIVNLSAREALPWLFQSANVE